MNTQTIERSQRYAIRAKVSMLFREANLHEDRQNIEGRVKAMRLRAEANDLNEELRRKA